MYQKITKQNKELMYNNSPWMNRKHEKVEGLLYGN